MATWPATGAPRAAAPHTGPFATGVSNSILAPRGEGKVARPIPSPLVHLREAQDDYYAIVVALDYPQPNMNQTHTSFMARLRLWNG